MLCCWGFPLPSPPRLAGVSNGEQSRRAKMASANLLVGALGGCVCTPEFPRTRRETWLWQRRPALGPLPLAGTCTTLPHLEFISPASPGGALWQLLASCAAPGMIILCAARESGRVFWVATAGPRRSRLAPGDAHFSRAPSVPLHPTRCWQFAPLNSAGKTPALVGLSQAPPFFSLALGTLWWPKTCPAHPTRGRARSEDVGRGSPMGLPPPVPQLYVLWGREAGLLLLLLEGQRLPPLPHSSSCLPSRLAGNASNSGLVESLQCCNHKSQRGGRRPGSAPRVPSRGSQTGFTARRNPG